MTYTNHFRSVAKRSLTLGTLPVSSDRVAFRDGVLTVLDATVGVAARRRAERQLAVTNRCDIFGVAFRHEIRAVPTIDRIARTAYLWAAENGYLVGQTDPAVDSA
jgi:hypothetical protein